MRAHRQNKRLFAVEGHSVPGGALAAAAAAPLARLLDPTSEDRALWLEPLSHDVQAE